MSRMHLAAVSIGVLTLAVAAYFRLKQRLFLTATEADLKGVVRTNLDSPKPTDAQLSRRLRNGTIIKRLGLPVNDKLPVLDDDRTVRIRTLESVVDRCIATEVCALKGEGSDATLIERVTSMLQASAAFSPVERAFIGNPEPSAQILANYAWGYEHVHVLLWALGHLSNLNPPNEVCDVPAEVKLIRDLGRDGLLKRSKLRAPSEILDAADLYYRLHWAAIELRLGGSQMKEIDEEIVMERHRALNWLITHLNQEWDDVTTDT